MSQYHERRQALIKSTDINKYIEPTYIRFFLISKICIDPKIQHWLGLTKPIDAFVFYVPLNEMLSQTATWLQVMLCFYLTICRYCLTLRASQVSVWIDAFVCLFCTLVYFCKCSYASPHHHIPPVVWGRGGVGVLKHLADTIGFGSLNNLHPESQCEWLHKRLSGILHTCHLIPDRIHWCDPYRVSCWLIVNAIKIFVNPFALTHLNQQPQLTLTQKKISGGMSYWTCARGLPNTPKCTASQMKVVLECMFQS